MFCSQSYAILLRGAYVRAKWVGAMGFCAEAPTYVLQEHSVVGIMTSMSCIAAYISYVLYVCLFALSEFYGFMVWFTIRTHSSIDNHWQYYIVDDCSS